MNKFVFITHVTPAAKRNPLRQQLFELYEKALLNQSYSDWFVIQLHEGADAIDGKFYRFHLPDASREEKNRVLQNLFQRNDFVSLIRSADYLIKLDDDDLISPVMLQQLSEFTGDLFYDRFHTFYDISSGTLSQQERPWVASTCVHKTEHALAPWSGEGHSAIGNLLYTDHSKAWHKYYADLKSVQADPLHPVYMRVLSPTSITSGGHSQVKTIGETNIEGYYRYLHTFGNWKPANVSDFDVYRQPLAKAWEDFSGTKQFPIPSRGIKEKLSARLQTIKNKLNRK